MWIDFGGKGGGSRKQRDGGRIQPHWKAFSGVYSLVFIKLIIALHFILHCIV